jgi:hypothetical protein
MLDPLGGTAFPTHVAALLKLKVVPGGAILETCRTPGCAAASVVPRTAKENIPNRQKSAE